jgi:hypothetical protein
MYLSGLHANLSGLTAEQAYAKGDLNGDGVNDFQDLVLFRSAFNTAHGAGSFAALRAAVPEPALGALIPFAVAFAWLTRTSRPGSRGERGAANTFLKQSTGARWLFGEYPPKSAASSSMNH